MTLSECKKFAKEYFDTHKDMYITYFILIGEKTLPRFLLYIDNIDGKFQQILETRIYSKSGYFIRQTREYSIKNFSSYYNLLNCSQKWLHEEDPKLYGFDNAYMILNDTDTAYTKAEDIAYKFQLSQEIHEIENF